MKEFKNTTAYAVSKYLEQFETQPDGETLRRKFGGRLARISRGRGQVLRFSDGSECRLLYGRDKWACRGPADHTLLSNFFPRSA